MRRIFLPLALLSCSKGGVDVAATVNPLYLIAEEIVGPELGVERLVPPGANPHLYEPKPSDLAKASGAKLLVFGGELLEPWAARVEGPLKVDAYKAGKGTGGDPHVWLDPERAVLIAKAVAEAASRVWPSKRKVFQENFQKFKKEVDSLDRWFAGELSKLPDRRFVAVHPAFGYLAARYGLEQVAVLEKAPGAEPRPRQLEGVIKMMKEEGVKAVFATPGAPQGLLETLEKEAEARVVVIDPLGREASSYPELLKKVFDGILEALK